MMIFFNHDIVKMVPKDLEKFQVSGYLKEHRKSGLYVEPQSSIWGLN